VLRFVQIHGKEGNARLECNIILYSRVSTIILMLLLDSLQRHDEFDYFDAGYVFSTPRLPDKARRVN
jgi:hypothetical protein